MVLHLVMPALRKLRQECHSKSHTNLSHISSKSACAPLSPSRSHTGLLRGGGGECRRTGLTGACWEHLASTYNRHRVAHGMGVPRGASALAAFLQQVRICQAQRPGQLRQARPPGHALSRIGAACQPWAGPTAILRPPARSSSKACLVEGS